MSEAKRKLNHIFASAVFNARTEREFTQEETAEIINVSTRWYQKIEAGTGTPNFQHTIHLMALFCIDPKLLAEENGLALPKHSKKHQNSKQLAV